MSMTRILALGLAVSVATVSLPASSFADQATATGSMSGRASAEARKPYTDYVVQLRDPATGLVTLKIAVDAKGLFSFTTVPLSRRFVVELLNTKSNQVVCTEGPYILTANATTRSDININCGANPAAWALIAGGAVATTAAVLKASGGN
jgi:hypothetical protein